MAVVVAASIVLATTTWTHVAEVKVLGSPAVRGAFDELARQFERETGYRVVAHYDVFAVVVRRVEQGEPFDMLVLSPALTDELVATGVLAADARFDLGGHGVALGAREGVRLPDISTAEGLSAAVRAATSIGYFNEGTAGAHFLAVARRLGLASELNRVARGFDAEALDLAIREGRVQYVAAGLATLRALPGIGDAALLPADHQQHTSYVAAVGRRAPQAGVARAFGQFLVTASARRVFERHGLTPVPR